MEKCNDCKKMVKEAPFGQCDDCGGGGETSSLARFEWCDETNNYVCDWYGEYDFGKEDDNEQLERNNIIR